MEIDTATTMDNDNEEDIRVDTSAFMNNTTTSMNNTKSAESAEKSLDKDTMDMDDTLDNKEEEKWDNVVISIKSRPMKQVLLWQEEKRGIYSILLLIHLFNVNSILFVR